ncbi:hypothetical protein Vretimale_8284, partial [Volvox reticuliferus]
GTLGVMAESSRSLPQMQPHLEAAGSGLVAVAAVAGTPAGAARQLPSALPGGDSGVISLPFLEHHEREDHQHRLLQARGSSSSSGLQALSQIGSSDGVGGSSNSGGGGDGIGGGSRGNGRGSAYRTSAWRQTTRQDVLQAAESESLAAAIAAPLEDSDQRFFRLTNAAQLGGPGLVSSVSDGALAAYLGPTSSLIVGEANWSVSQQ